MKYNSPSCWFHLGRMLILKIRCCSSGICVVVRGLESTVTKMSLQVKGFIPLWIMSAIQASKSITEISWAYRFSVFFRWKFSIKLISDTSHWNMLIVDRRWWIRELLVFIVCSWSRNNIFDIILSSSG